MKALWVWWQMGSNNLLERRLPTGRQTVCLHGRFSPLTAPFALSDLALRCERSVADGQQSNDVSARNGPSPRRSGTALLLRRVLTSKSSASSSFNRLRAARVTFTLKSTRKSYNCHRKETERCAKSNGHVTNDVTWRRDSKGQGRDPKLFEVLYLNNRTI